MFYIRLFTHIFGHIKAHICAVRAHLVALYRRCQPSVKAQCFPQIAPSSCLNMNLTHVINKTSAQMWKSTGLQGPDWPMQGSHAINPNHPIIRACLVSVLTRVKEQWNACENDLRGRQSDSLL